VRIFHSKTIFGKSAKPACAGGPVPRWASASRAPSQGDPHDLRVVV
jgi:hypothetical protein